METCAPKFKGAGVTNAKEVTWILGLRSLDAASDRFKFPAGVPPGHA